MYNRKYSLFYGKSLQFRNFVFLGETFPVDRSIKIGTYEGTSPCNKSRGQVPACELAIFASKSRHRDQALVPAIGPTNSNQFEFLGQVAATCSSKRFV